MPSTFNGVITVDIAGDLVYDFYELFCCFEKEKKGFTFILSFFVPIEIEETSFL